MGVRVVWIVGLLLPAGPALLARSGLDGAPSDPAVGGLPAIAAIAIVPDAPAPLPGSMARSGFVATPNGSLGSVAFTWHLADNSVDSGAVNQRYSVTPDRLLYVPTSHDLWTAFASPPFGQPFNVTVVNRTNGAADVLSGVGNVTGFAYDPVLGAVSLTEIPPSGGGELVSFRAGSHELARTPTPVGPHPTALALAAAPGTLWVLGWANQSRPGTVTIVSEASGLVRSVVPVGLNPTAVAFDESANLAFVANSGSNNLTVLHESDGSPAAASISLPGPVVPGAFGFDNATGLVVGLVQVGSVPAPWLFELLPTSTTPVLLARLPGNATASTLAIDPSTRNVYVASETVANSTAGGGNLYRYSFSTLSWSVVAFVGQNPDAQAFDVASSTDYVGHQGQTYVSAVNVSLSNVAPTVLEFGGGPRGGAFDPSNGQVYVVDSFDGGSAGTAPDILQSISPAAGTPAERVSPAPPGVTPLGAGLVGVVDDPSSARLFVADRGWSQASVLGASNESYVGRIPLPFAPIAVTDDAQRGLVYFASATGQVVSYDSVNLTRAGSWNLTAPTVATTASFESLAVDPTTGDVVVLVPDLGSGGVSGVWIVTPANGSARFVALGSVGAGALGDYPTSVAVDPLVGDAYVGRSTGTVQVVNVTNASLVATASVGSAISYLTFDPGRRLILGGDSGGGSLLLLNGTAPAFVGVRVGVVPVGPDPEGVTVDTASDQVVVSDYGSATLDAFSVVPEVASLTVHVTIPTVGELPGTTDRDDVGRPVLIDALAGGGAGPLTFSYSGLPAGCLTANTSHLFCQPTAAGNATLSVTATDRGGRSAGASISLEVDAAPTVRGSATPAAADGLGTSVTLRAAVTGGNDPFRYTFGFGDSTKPVSWTVPGRNLSLAHPYDSPGVFVATVSVTDRFGAIADAVVPVTIGSSMTGSAAVVGELPSYGPGRLFALEADVSGGVAPYRFSWTFPAGPRVVEANSTANRSTVNETFAVPGVQEVQVWVNDSANGTLRLFLNVTVPAPEGGAPLGILPWLLAGVVVTAVALGWVLWRRRKQPATGPGAPPEKPG